MEKTSIIVPIYRGGKYIDGMIAQIEDCAAKCDSVCALELLFVNDDPPEPVGNLASEMMEIKVIETERNRGIHGARVRGLERPEYATPLGIAISAGLGLLNDSYVVMLNGQSAKLFRNGVLTLRDILLMNGYSYADMVGKTGKSLNLTVDGKRVVLRGEPAVPAVLQVNGEEAALSTLVHAGDHIRFIPARNGESAHRTLEELLGPGFFGKALVNNGQVPLNTPLEQGDVVLTMRQTPPAAFHPEPPPAAPQPSRPAAAPAARPSGLHITLNGEALELPAKENGSHYYLMDLLEYSGIDFEHLDRAVRLEVNGKAQGFQYQLKAQDSVVISLE